MTPIVVYLNLSESRTFPQQHAGWLRDAVYHWLKEFGPVEVTLDRPDRFPGSYVEVRYGPRLGWMSRRLPEPVASLNTARLLDAPLLGEVYGHVIWHDERYVRAPDGAPPHALVEAVTLATVHEYGHALRAFDHTHLPREQSYEWWARGKKNHPIAAANLALYHTEKGEVTT